MIRKMKKMITLIITLILMIQIISVNKISANTNLKIVKTAYYLSNDQRPNENQAYHLYLNSETVFCLDPKVAIDEKAIYAKSANQIVDQKIARIAYLGYYLPAKKHLGFNDEASWQLKQGDINYLNTQALIWEVLGSKVKINTPDYEVFKSRVLSQLERFIIKPSFDGKTINLKSNETKVLKDENNVLNDFVVNEELANQHKLAINIQNNELKITNNSGDNKDIYLKDLLIKYPSITPMNFIYEAKGSQVLARLGAVDHVSASLNIKKGLMKKWVTIWKQDSQTKQNLADVKLALYDEQGLISKFTTNINGNKFNLEVGKTYYLKELQPLPNYQLANELKFIVDENTNDIILENKRILESIDIYKLASDTKRPLENVHLQLWHNNELIDDWLTTTKAHRINHLLAGETYRLKEVSSVKGYKKSEDLVFEVKDNGKKIQEVILINHVLKGTLKLHKLMHKNYQVNQDIAAIDYGEYEVSDLSNNQKIGTLKINNGISNTLTDLNLNHAYLLKETKAPRGYHLGYFDKGKRKNQIVVKFDDNNINKVIKVYDDKSLVKIHKLDEKNNYVKNAKLALYDENQKLVTRFTTNDCAYVISGLKINKQYYLVEEKAPLGYEKAQQVSFIVDEDKQIQNIKMIDHVQKDYVDTADPMMKWRFTLNNLWKHLMI